MRRNHTLRVLLQSLLLFVLSASLVAVSGEQSLPALARSAELTALDRANPINVRANPSTLAKLLHYGFAGDPIEILDQTQANGEIWYDVKFDRSGAVGWVRGDLVHLLPTMPPKLGEPLLKTPLQRTSGTNSFAAGNPFSSVAPKGFDQSSNCTMIYPVPHPIVNFGFGLSPDPFNPGQTRFHTGVDFDGRIGDPIYSPVCGVVIYVGRETNITNYDSGYGWHIKLKDAAGRTHLFGHITKSYVRVGDLVHASQHIADIGHNGNSTGPHLHYEIREGVDDHDHAVNPMLFLAHAKQTPSLQTQPVQVGGAVNSQESNPPLHF
jgi:murein DD-endopeptidase MepM/ murein hydrolase activator NlpD